MVLTASFDSAAAICAQIENENKRRWYTFNGMWCRGCVTFTHGEIEKRCFNSTPDHRGCAQVNARLDRLKTAG